MPPDTGTGTVTSAPGVPYAARTPTWKARGRAADSAAAAAGGGRREAAPAGRRARGWLGSGAAVSGTDSGDGGGAAPPVVRRAAAPPLPRAGRTGGAALWAPRPGLANLAGVDPPAAGAPAALGPRRGTLTVHARSGAGPALQTSDALGCSSWAHPRPGTVGTSGCRDHRRGHPDRASRGLSALEAVPPSQASAGGPEWPEHSRPGARSL